MFRFDFYDLSTVDRRISKGNLKFCDNIMEFFEISDSNGIRTVRINNTKKKNAINKQAYYALARILNEAGQDVNVKCVVITGNGDFFR